LLSSEANSGIKIPSGQIAGGQFVIAAGETKDLDIDFNACESVVAQGNGQFRLKPVLHAGEVTLTSISINGTVVDSVTSQPIPGGTTVVALEQKDSSGIDRMVMETVTTPSGAFSFCPVAAGTYDVVVGTVGGAQLAYAVTVIARVQPATRSAADISLSTLQPISSSLMVTIPLAGQSAAMANLTTAVGSTLSGKNRLRHLHTLRPCTESERGFIRRECESKVRGSGSRSGELYHRCFRIYCGWNKQEVS
jgi:hypothetical protein